MSFNIDPKVKFNELTIASALTTGSSSWVPWQGLTRLVQISGTFDSATVVLEARHVDSTSDVIVLDGSYTANSVVQYTLNANYEIRATSSGGGGSQSINVFLVSQK